MGTRHTLKNTAQDAASSFRQLGAGAVRLMSFPGRVSSGSRWLLPSGLNLASRHFAEREVTIRLTTAVFSMKWPIKTAYPESLTVVRAPGSSPHLDSRRANHVS
ncbi:hypothetical protein V2G26_003156 [Clonostachys chloroleuca]